ncbi:unannotated protein [freshwater metagenome]|uniref:Unannotated protein n=1 Tax=freshwater metagenome TaxID=449393 RepID=A0A6J7SXJ3_9ZZZZ
MSVASSRGSPCLICLARSINAALNLSAIPRCTKNRVPDKQTCPALSYCSTATVTAISKSASSVMMSGLLPPSSNEHGTRFSAAALATSFAVGTEPVNEMRDKSGCAVKAAPASSPKP